MKHLFLIFALCFCGRAYAQVPHVVVTTHAHNIVLTWTASVSSGVTGYYVYRGTSSGGESGTPIALVSGTSYTDTNVAVGATYYYYLTAYNGSAQSSASSEVSATVPNP